MGKWFVIGFAALAVVGAFMPSEEQANRHCADRLARGVVFQSDLDMRASLQDYRAQCRAANNQLTR